jgi:hypothetical protein
MPHHIRRLAVALWLISFFVPASAGPNGSVAIGLEVALGSLALLFMFPVGLLGAPFQVISLLSNWLVMREIGQQLVNATTTQSLPTAVLLVLAATVNVSIGKHAAPWQDLLSYPGFYLWSSSFILLASVGAYENWSFFGGLLKRSLALGVVAAAVFILGLVAIFLAH